MNRKTVLTLFVGLIILMVGLFSASGSSVQHVSAATNTMTLSVISARTEPRAFGGAGVLKGASVTQYKYIINIDNTGTTEQRPNSTTGAPPVACTPADGNYPASCDWTSVAGVAGSSPIYTQGDQDDFAPSMSLPDGRYLISVLADGYKLDGVHFTMPLAGTGLVTVELQPQPLPDATIHAFVFEDISPTNGAPDVPAENGLPGFVGHIVDYLGEVTTDVYGNPLCTLYEGEDPVTHIIPFASLDADMLPIPIPGTGGHCVSDANGDLVMPHLGPNRYAFSAVAPDGTSWIQTTTLEGNHDWDAWIMEGNTGLDTEFIIAGEPFPAIIFGFVKQTPNLPAGPSGHIKGVIAAAKAYVPANGGVTGEPGITGAKIDQPIEFPWISLSDLTNGDTAIWIGKGNANGVFDIANVPNGNYFLSWWDEPQNYILGVQNVTVSNGEVVDLGILPTLGWWTKFDGYVFNDLNRNGIKDAGEAGVPGYTLTMRKRENSLMDRGATVVSTDATGYYIMENAYPMTQWLVMEAYNDLMYTTGVTYQADNQPTPTTILGAGVDVSVLPIIGLSGRLDWGVHFYDAVGAPGYLSTVLADGPIHYWRFEEISTAQSALDQGTIGGNNGTYTGGITLNQPSASVNLGKAARFDGASGTFVDAGLFHPGDSVTVEAWVNLETTADKAFHSAVSRWDGSYELDANQSTGDQANFVARNSGDAFGLSASAAPMTRGEWHHLAGVFDGTTGTLTTYLDGVAGASVALGGVLQNAGPSPDRLLIGATRTGIDPGSYNWTGLIDEVAIYDKALTAAQIQAHISSISAANVDPRNGGIVGTVSYDTTRNELDAQFAFVEDWQPGISDLIVNLYQPVTCGTTGAPCDQTGRYELDADGAYSKGHQLNSYLTETWQRPGLNDDGTCVPRNVNGNRLAYPTDQQVTNDDTDCLEGPLMGVQFQAGFSAVDGNYGFGDGCFNGTLDATDPSDPICMGGSFETLLGGRDYLVEVEIPNDATGRPLFNLTREEDINIGNGDQWVPQVPPPICAGSLHTVDVANNGIDGYPANTTFIPGVTVPASTPTLNPTFEEITSPYEGTPKPLCDTKLVPLNNGRSIVPTFNFFTDVPLPGRMWGLLVDDLNFSANPHSLGYGEKAGIPFAPVGIYDWTNRLVATVESDYNGIFDVLLPSTNRINCPTPSGVCANLYRFVGNDPGVPGQLNTNYKPEFRTIAAEFEAIPGLIVPADLAPTQVGVSIQIPGGQVQSVSCALPSTTPQLFRVSQPYVNGSGSFTITGLGFGTSGQVTFDGTIVLPTTGWSNTQINVTVPAGTPVGPHQLAVTANNGQTTINGLTFHVRGGSYNPNLYEVGPARSYATIQSAIDAAQASAGSDLVVVYPGQPDLSNPRANPRGAYYENLIVNSPIKLQGVGPGGFQGATFVPGSIIDGGAFGGDGIVATNWYVSLGGITWDGNQEIYDGAVVSIFAQATGSRAFTAGYNASIDGFDLRGGNQQGFPGNINEIGGLPTGAPANLVTQGGALFANGYARYLQISNNTIQNNGGAYGTVRLGTPDLPAPDTNNHNENVRILNNRVILNAGTNLAGGIGLFAGADNYLVAKNDLCGNFSAEYGGGLTVYGLSPNGTIRDNRIYFNRSYDEGGGVMIAGALPTDPLANYGTPNGPQGSGPATIYNNVIQANLSNDDGGGIRFLQAGNFPMNVYNNMIVNNVSTHEGGGIGINDAPNVRVFNNTIMKNQTTATAVTSNGFAAPAGLSTSQNSAQLQATLAGGSPTFSNPLLFNNIFWDNRAGTLGLNTVTGLGAVGDASPIDHWDLGVADGTGVMAPTNSVIQQLPGVGARAYTDVSNNHADPAVVSPYDIAVAFNGWRTNPNFIGAILVAVDLPPTLLGDYHLLAGSPAVNLGAASKNSVNAPAFDIDNQVRPAGGGFDSGADELAAPAPPPTALYFSTLGNTNPTGVSGTADDADIYLWNGAAFSRVIDVSGAPYNLPGSANADGYARVDATHFYMSFTANVSVPGIGTVADEDIVYWNGGAWSLWFDGSAYGLGGAGTDLGAISIVGNTLYFSTNTAVVPPGVVGAGDNADIYRWNGGNSYTRVIDASALGWSTSNVDGLIWVDATHVYLSYSSTTTTVPTLGSVQDEDVVYFNAGTWSVFFDGTAQGLTASNQDLDAISFASGATPPPPPPPPAAANFYFSTSGSVNPPGVSGTADNADIYSWNGTAFSRAVDVTAMTNGLPTSANVDGLQWVDATHFYLSFSSTTTPVPTLGNVEDEDVVYYNNGSWSIYFDGTAHGLTSGNLDLDGFQIVGSTLYFSTLGNTNPPGVGGTADDADIYAWNGTSFSRVFDASTFSLPSNANVRGMAWTDASNFYLTFASANTAVPTLGNVQDEDVVKYSSGIWSVYFDGTALGLTANGHDLDGFSFAP